MKKHKYTLRNNNKKQILIILKQITAMLQKNNVVEWR